MINHVKSLLKKAGKKHYTFAVGKLNVAKLANFMEIDVYVLVACHENSLLDSAEFYRPVITPHELELACNPQRHWDGGIVTDFQQLLPGGDSHVALPDGDISPTVDVSLVTGNMRTLGVQDEDEQKQDGGQASSALMLRNQNTQLTLANTAQSAGLCLVYFFLKLDTMFNVASESSVFSVFRVHAMYSMFFFCRMITKLRWFQVISCHSAAGRALTHSSVSPKSSRQSVADEASPSRTRKNPKRTTRDACRA